MQIWASKNDLKSKKMTTLVSHAHTFRMLASRGEFALRLPSGGDTACSAMLLNNGITVADLKGIASASAGIPSRRLTLTHLGSELARGTLVANGVLPGSCIIGSAAIGC